MNDMNNGITLIGSSNSQVSDKGPLMELLS